jgi:TPR repeat protein
MHLDKAMSANNLISAAKELIEAKQWLSKLAGKTDRDKPIDASKIVQWCLVAAAQGSVLAQFTVGLSYMHGSGVQQDFVQARFWLQKAAQSGDVNSQVNLGQLYYKKEDGSQDFRLALEWFEKAAAQENCEARHFLGEIYQEGKGVPKDIVKARQLYLLAAQQGFPPAQHRLGDIYCAGDGVPENHQEGFKWYLKSAKQGFDLAQCAVGTVYALGYAGQLQDVIQAAKWFRLAAAQNNVIALNNLAAHYGSGLGVPMNRVAGYAMYKLSFMCGLNKESGKHMLSALATMLTQKQIQLANTLIEKFIESNDFLQTLDDHVKNHPEKDDFANNNEYMEEASRMLTVPTQRPVNLPTNNLPAKLNRSQRRSKSKKR